MVLSKGAAPLLYCNGSEEFSQSEITIRGEIWAAYGTFLAQRKGAKSAKKFTAYIDDCVNMVFTRYGCVLLAYSILGSEAHRMSHLYLLGLDEWNMRTDLTSHGMAYSSSSEEWKRLSLGRMKTDRIDGLIKLVSDLIKRLNGRDISSGEKKKGHQRTPACIEAVVRDAIKFYALNQDRHNLLARELDNILDNGRLPRGGFTDVGRHSGGQARETTWPLAKAVIGSFMEQSQSHSGPVPAQPSFEF
jgi:hypothetical protein